MMKFGIPALMAALIMLFGASNAAAQFGKNKVQYKEYEWKYIESKHFDIYYHDSAKYLAEFTAINAEEDLPKIERILGFKLTKRVSIIVYNSQNDFQQTNIISEYLPGGVGGVTELLKNRVVLPFFGSYSLFKHVICHELVHAVMNDMFYGGTFQSALYSGNIANLPIWICEGLAEWVSIGKLDFETDVFMRDVFLASVPFGLQDLEGYYAYRGGQCFYWYVDKTYGTEKITELLNRFKTLKTADAAFRGAFGMSLEDFSEKWVADMKKYYYPDIAKFKAPEDFSVRVTNHEKTGNFYNTSPAVSPDGSKMVYIADREGLFRIFLMDLETKDREKSKPVELISSFRSKDFEDLNLLTPSLSWSPDGKKIAVSAKAGEFDALYIVDPATTDYKKIDINMKSVTSVAWSPDGKKIAFVGNHDTQTDIFTYDIETAKIDNLTDDIFTDQAPVWSRDGKLIYFISDRDSLTDGHYTKKNFKIVKHNVFSSDIFSYEVASGRIRRITRSPEYSKTSIACSEDGTKLLYTSDQSGIGNIFEYDLASGAVRPLTNALSGISQISLSSDSRVLLFSTLRTGGYDIFKIKNPFETHLAGDTIPLTSLREKLNATKMKIASAQNAVQSSGNKSPEETITYGNFVPEFSRQKVVRPNSDAVKVDPMTDSGYSDTADTTFIERDYKIKFTPDVVLGNPGYSTFYGFQGMAQAMFSDQLGNHQLFVQANLLYDLKNSSFAVTYLYLPQQIDYAITGYHTAGYVTLRDGDLYRFRKYGTELAAYYPFDFFNRVEWGVNLMAVTREDIDNSNNASLARFLFVPQASYVHDDVLWGNYAPYKGTRYNITVTGAPKLSTEGAGFMNITADYRAYFNLSKFINFAVRGSAGASMGPDPQKFAVGGTENWMNASFKNGYLPFETPEQFAFTQFIMPLRGFAVNEASGDKFFLLNTELRLPMRIFIASPLPMLIQDIRTLAFMDMAGVWSGNFSDFKASKRDIDGFIVPNNLWLSSGTGIRAFVLGLPVKLDIAWTYLFHTWSEPQYEVSLGFDF